MSKLVWLHLSDIHFLPSNEWQDSTARSALLTFLAEKLTTNHLKIDLIFCTGDIAFGELGRQTLTEQYTLARQFFDQVLDLCGCDKSRLFVVPGNHDINRHSITKAERKSWADWGSTDALKMADEIPSGFASFDADTKAAMRRLTEWGEFVADYLPHQEPAGPGHYHYAQTITISGRKIGIAGFNSAWTCAGDEDDRRLWLAAAPQFDYMRTKLQGADLKIGLIHHPLDWFNHVERHMIKQRIAVDAHFWLHGHTHNAWVEPLPSHITLGAGAVAAHSQDEFGCNLVQLDLDGGRGQAHLYRYNKTQARWIDANDIVPTGGSIWNFALPQKVYELGQSHLVVGAAAALPPEKSEADILANLLAWCNRGELVATLADYLEQPATPAVGLLCLTAHIENRYEILMDRVSVELGKRVRAKTSKVLYIRQKIRFDSFDNFEKDLCEQLGIANVSGLLLILSKARLDVHLLCLYVDCTGMQGTKIQLLLRTVAAWVDKVNGMVIGPYRLVLVLMLRYSDTVTEVQTAWRVSLGSLFGHTSTLRRIERIFGAEVKKGITPLLLSNLLVLGGYDADDFLRWVRLPMVKDALGLTEDDDLADDGFIAEHFAGGTRSFRQLLEFVLKQRK